MFWIQGAPRSALPLILLHGALQRLIIMDFIGAPVTLCFQVGSVNGRNQPEMVK